MTAGHPDTTLHGEPVRFRRGFRAGRRGRLTPAELGILRFLPTHYSLPQIAAQAHVSPNTVKTQAQAVYRKLGVSSRREAVEGGRRAAGGGTSEWRR
jgi:DNA-binding CsgD family transcriptional regulator